MLPDKEGALRRYPQDKELSWVVDMLTKKEEECRVVQDPDNADLLRQARDTVIMVVDGLPGVEYDPQGYERVVRDAR
jgi:hypothetical protein